MPGDNGKGMIVLGDEDNRKRNEEKSMHPVKKGEDGLAQGIGDHFILFERHIQQGLDVQDGHLLKHVTDIKVEGQVVDHKPIDDPQRVSQSLFFDDEIGSYPQREKDQDKVECHKDHQDLVGEVGLKGCCAEERLPLKDKKMLKHGPGSIHLVG